MEKEPTILLLWDIDGTLLLTGGIAGRLMVKSVEEEVGKSLPYTPHIFIGSTDRLIVRQLLERVGYAGKDVEPVIDRILSRYIHWLREALSGTGKVQVLPGVREILETTRVDKNFANALLTGNIREGALIKLRAAGLVDLLPVGAYGDDDINRNNLPPVAIKRAEAYYGQSFPPHRVWIIGDSPKDILCARANRIRVLAVATGRPSLHELAKFQPDILVEDLQDTELTLNLIRQKTESGKT